MARIRGWAARSLNLRQSVVKFAAPGIVRSVIGMQRHGPEQPAVQLHGLNGEPGGLEVAAHLHGALYSNSRGGIQGGGHGHGRGSVRKIKVRVVVHDRHRQRLRSGREILPARGPGSAAGFLCGSTVGGRNQRIAHRTSLAAPDGPGFTGTLCQAGQLC